MDPMIKMMLEMAAIIIFFVLVLEFSTWSTWIRTWLGRGIAFGAVWFTASELWKLYKTESILVPAEIDKDKKE